MMWIFRCSSKFFQPILATSGHARAVEVFDVLSVAMTSSPEVVKTSSVIFFWIFGLIRILETWLSSVISSTFIQMKACRKTLNSNILWCPKNLIFSIWFVATKLQTNHRSRNHQWTKRSESRINGHGDEFGHQFNFGHTLGHGVEIFRISGHGFGHGRNHDSGQFVLI